MSSAAVKNGVARVQQVTPRWAEPGTLYRGHTSIQDHKCVVCGAAIPAGTPHQYRSMSVYHACAGCEYPLAKANCQ